MKRKLFLTFLLTILISAVLSAQNKNVVFLVSQNQNTYEKLDANEKLYARSAFQSFVGNLTLLNEISVRTEANDSSLRQVQKQSQIDASKGLGNEDSAYASDLGVKAVLRLEVSLVKYNSGYKLEYTASNIETMQIISSGSSESYFDLEKIDFETDKLSYSALKSLYSKGYISDIPYNVEVQLTHAKDTSENYSKYIMELTQQIDDNREELDKIRKDNQTAQEKVESLRKEQALQQKIQAAENARRKTEEQLRRYQEEKEKVAKQDAELKTLAEKKRSDLAKKFQEKIKQSQEQQEKLNREIIQGLSLEKRIELIEADRQVLDELETQLLSQIEKGKNDLREKRDAEVDEIMQSPWRLAETDAYGRPTEKARKYRESKAKKVNDKYEKLINESGNDMKAAYAPAISAYEKQIEKGIAALEATEFVFRSYEHGSNLSVTVGDYDGELFNWTVEPSFSMKETEKITNIPDLSLLSITVSYKDITGKNPVEFNGKNEDAYSDYMDAVELADICFRTSTPYIYGTLSIKVKYNSTYGNYRLVFNHFNLKRMEDNLVVADFSQDDYNVAIRGTVRKTQERETVDLQRRMERQERQQKYESQRQEQHNEVRGLLGNFISYWTPNLRQRDGITVNLNTDVLTGCSNTDFRLFFGGNGPLYYLVEFGFDDFEGLDNISFGGGLGTSFNFGCFRPYTDLTFAAGKTTEHYRELDNFRFGTRTGLDVVLGSLIMGSYVNFEIRYGDNYDFFDHYESIGFTIGICF
ncbi:MAG: hypothetical protein MJ182_01110 [Treponema sp.]|nr:hypothetical protein [Treponema sp.]